MRGAPGSKSPYPGCGARQDQNLLTQENERFGVKRQHTNTAGTWSKASTTERGKVDRIQPSRPAAAAGSRYCKPPSASKNISPASLHRPTSLIGAGGSEQQATANGAEVSTPVAGTCICRNHRALPMGACVQQIERCKQALPTGHGAVRAGTCVYMAPAASWRACAAAGRGPVFDFNQRLRLAGGGLPAMPVRSDPAVAPPPAH